MEDVGTSKQNPEKPADVPEMIVGRVNLKKEEDERICAFAEDKRVALIAIIAPYVPVRVSPIEVASASIGLQEEFGIEAIVTELSRTGVKDGYLLVNSPGGGMDSSYKIARALRRVLDRITVFVPHVAASGGALLALTGNEIVMGPMSNITPVDVQVPYGGTYISATTFMRFLARATKWFERTRPEEAPYPRTALANKLDPFVMEEWGGATTTVIHYLEEILQMAGYGEKSGSIARELATGYPIHGYVITEEKAKQLGLHIGDSSKYPEAWKLMRYWLGKYMLEEVATHCIRYVIPSSAGKEEPQNGKKKKKRNRSDIVESAQ